MIKTLPIQFDQDRLLTDLYEVIETFDIKRADQLCLTYAPDKPKHPDHNIYQGCGSLNYEVGLRGGEDLEWIKRKDSLTEKDFTAFIPELKHTYFYHVYEELKKIYNIGRVRIVMLHPNRCLTWHKDVSKRIHIPIITNPGNKLVIEDNVYFLPTGKTYEVQTTNMHSAFNGGKSKRYNLLMSTVPTDIEEQKFNETLR